MGHHVQILQVAPQTEAALPRSVPEEVFPQPVGLPGDLFAVALGEGPEALGVALALKGERLTQMIDIRVFGMALRHLPEAVGQVGLRPT